MIAPNLQEEEVALYDEHYSGPTYNIVGKQYKSMKFKFLKLGRTKPNNCVYLNEQSIVIIENFVKRNNAQLFIVGRKFENVSDLYTFPINSSQLGIYVVRPLGNLDVWALSDINCKGFIIPSFISPDSFVVSPLLAQISRSRYSMDIQLKSTKDLDIARIYGISRGYQMDIMCRLG